jgi:hypothetical protein
MGAVPATSSPRADRSSICDRPDCPARRGRSAVGTADATAGPWVEAGHRHRWWRQWKEEPMFACPRCGNDAEYLTDDVFTLVRCEFCGENLDAADLVLRAALDRITQTPPAAAEELLPPLELEPV